MAAIKSSELITNPDGSIFHLHLLPEELANDVILVGDPARVERIAARFERVETRKSNREFYSVTGEYRGHRLTVVSTGIGPDNIDIVVNELDALANIDLRTKEVKSAHRSLNLVRIGTSGAVQGDIPTGSFVISGKSVGCDGVLRFYAGNEEVCDRPFEEAFIRDCHWTPSAARPYAVEASAELVERLHDERRTIRGITLTAVGFYAPQGRVLRLPLAMPGINDRITAFRFGKQKITNYEMESAPITGLCRLLGHRSTTICLIIANRITGEATSDYQPQMEELIDYTLERLTQSHF